MAVFVPSDSCTTYSSFLPLSDYLPASSFCSSFSCTNDISTITATTTAVDTAFATTTSTLISTEIDTITTTSISTLTTPNPSTITQSVTSTAPTHTITSTITVTVTSRPAKRDVCETTKSCTTYVSTAIVPRVITWSASCTESASTVTIHTSYGPTASSESASVPAYETASAPAYESVSSVPATTYSGKTYTPGSTTYLPPSCTGSCAHPSKSLCTAKATQPSSTVKTTVNASASQSCIKAPSSLSKSRTRLHSTKSKCASAGITSTSAASSSFVISSRASSSVVASSQVSSSRPSSTAVSSSRPFSTSVDPLASLLSTLRAQPSTYISSACACIEGYSCTTTLFTATSTATTTYTSTLTAQTTVTATSTSTAAVFVTITSMSPPVTVTTTTTTTPSITVTATATATVTPSGTCVAHNFYTIYQGFDLVQTATAYLYDSYSPGSQDVCVQTCAISFFCGAFSYKPSTDECLLYTVGNQQDPADAGKYTKTPSANHNAGILTSDC